MEFFRNNRGKLPLVIIIAAAVLVLGGGAFVVFKGKIVHASGKAKKVEKVDLTAKPLGEFMVTLADTGELRYLKCELTLEMEADGKAKKAEKAGGEGSPEDAKLRDVIISTLSSKTVAELLADKSKANLKEQLKAALNKNVDGMKVHDVFFTSFAMQ